jgi:predicted transcriptional regulator
MKELTFAPNKSIQRLDLLTNWLLALILIIPFLISFGALRDLAAQNAVSYPWLYPIMIDGGLIIFKAVVLRASLRGRRDSYAWVMAVLATAISVYLNVVHVPPTLPQLGLARFMAALPPLVILVAFIAVSRRIEESARLDKAIYSYEQIRQAAAEKRRELEAMTAEKTAELDAIVQKRTAEIERLTAQIERLTVQKSDLQNDVRTIKTEQKASDLGKLTVSTGAANTIRLSKKEQAIADLLQFLDANPDASLTEIAVEIGRSKSTVGSYISELSANGQLHKNGHGWEVTAG